ncbi:Hypothetical predicted protein, partial [Paramuricea clavata]
MQIFSSRQNPSSTSQSSSSTSIPVMSDYTQLNTETLRKLVCTAVEESTTAGTRVKWTDLSYKPQWWPEEVAWRNPNNKSTAGPKMKSAELSLVLSAHRDWHESTSHPGAGPSHEQQPHSGRSDENHFVSAATECDLSAEDIAFMESVIKEDDDNSTIDFYDEACCSKVLTICRKLSWRALKICASGVINKMNNRTALVPYVHDYIDLERLDRSLLSFIPPFSKMLSEDGGIELEPFQASAFGNCFWCSLSIHLTGNESRQNFLRLASALNAVINTKHFIDKVRNHEEMGTPLDILWVPLTVEHGQSNHYNHIVPLLPWKCGAAPHKFCMFNSDMNHEFSNLKSDLAQCDLCQEWYHTCCLGQSLHHINRMERFSCGCDVLPGDAAQISTRNAEIYNDMDMFQRCLSKRELKMIAKNLKRNVIPYLRTGASYLDDSFTNEMKLYFESLDYGPVMTPNM